ncbi:MAG: hypothetical protein GXX91_00150 [Verrucomicrobiaceae bacterium]|nr:hypothetical protein [Verrucomicrobiaceae bacterium]
MKAVRQGPRNERIEELQDAVLEILLVHFGAVPECFVAPIRATGDAERLRALHRAADASTSLDEFERALLRE